MATIKKYYKSKYAFTILGLLLGALIGFMYYHFIGCANGTCAITSKPLNSTLYGALVGGLIFYPSKTKKI